MTGHQDNPANGCTIKKEKNKEVNLELLSKAIGVERIAVVDPFNLDELEKVIKAEIAAEEPSVIIVKRKCVLIEKNKETSPCCVTSDCIGCMQCLKLGCPCIVKENKRVVINSTQCVGCGLCQTVCTRKAIKKEGVQ
jgi:indolepyruvate ferredoxin oxidoreductase alpha subunit